MSMPSPLVLITGATGYVGGRLLEVLEQQGRRLRCMARRPEYLRPRAAEETEVVQGDLLEPDGVRRALEGVHTAYYLAHSMGTRGRFEEEEKRGASNFAEAARDAGVQRIIYVGGLGSGEDLSPHLSSRHAS
ncbi:MAG: NAD(P)H-binding protein [Planctomycetota bacterium]|jgi:uncharacterized protein YbjT (DUF2867 family)